MEGAPVSQRVRMQARWGTSSAGVRRDGSWIPPPLSAEGWCRQQPQQIYDQLQNVIEQVAKKDILIVQGDWNAEIVEDATTIWNGICGTSCNPMTNNKELRLLEFDCSSDLILENTI